MLCYVISCVMGTYTLIDILYRFQDDPVMTETRWGCNSILISKREINWIYLDGYLRCYFIIQSTSMYKYEQNKHC
jgi:hypothetical protein